MTTKTNDFPNKQERYIHIIFDYDIFINILCPKSGLHQALVIGADMMHESENLGIILFTELVNGEFLQNISIILHALD